MTVYFDEITALCGETGMQVMIDGNGTITLTVCMEADNKPDVNLTVVCDDAQILKDTILTAAALFNQGEA